jgi:hypothetical protein
MANKTKATRGKKLGSKKIEEVKPLLRVQQGPIR